MPSGDAKERYTVIADAGDAGLRLDAWLARAIPELSRAQVQKLIADGRVTVDGARALERRRIMKAGEAAAVAVPEPVDHAAQGESMALSIVFEDEDVIVIDKPAGLVVHPGAGHTSGTLVNALIAHCGASLSGIGGVRRPGIVHRLDKDTSGLLVIAKNDASHQALSEQFKSHGADGRLRRTYLAIVWGVPGRPTGIVDAPLARSAHNRTKIAVVRNERQGRRALTHYRVLERFQGAGREDIASLLELTLETGRTHQIRVHLAHIGHPVLGDPVYGAHFKTRLAHLTAAQRSAAAAVGRQALHAAGLAFEHPRSAQRLAFESKLPDEFQRLMKALRSTSQRPGEQRPGGRSSKSKS